MKYEFINELQVDASADDVWAIFGSPNLSKVFLELLPSMVESKCILEGDGGLGTVFRVVYRPGYVPHTYKEKIVTIDHDKRLKEVQQIEGGHLEMGFTSYMKSGQILEIKDCNNSCIIRSITKYEIKDDLEVMNNNVSSLITGLDTLVAFARAIPKYIQEQKKNSASVANHNK
ncbi:Bet v I domain [Macleaya cordata]|uniref:Bet v I domain n=1 Tax=Macleaya cordata TaxID=56857 RepID=A0A200PSS5_MACCD|nr:Bet v I domain [Macleaya cordata]